MPMRTSTLIPPIQFGRVRSEDMLTLPEDGKRYWLVDGHIVEMGLADRSRNRSRTISNLVHRLGNWVKSEPRPRGSLHIGEVGVILDPVTDLTVGIDVIYLSPEETARNATDDLSTIVRAANGILTLTKRSVAAVGHFDHFRRRVLRCNRPPRFSVS